MPKPVANWAHLRLKDRIRPGLDVLFVGINPGVQSAITGHHFAGFSNRFWKLLFESGLVPEPITYSDDDRFPEFGFGVTNLVARPSPGIDDLKPDEYLQGWKALERKIRHFRPRIVAFVGVTLYRALLPVLMPELIKAADVRKGARVCIPGAQPITIHGARLFVLPNPSGRNANYTYDEMLAAFRGLRKAVRKLNAEAGPSRGGS
jgi:TDG/mug DNA glycosylase family protein